MMKILNLLTSGNPGGIEILCKDVGIISTQKNSFCFFLKGGSICDEMEKRGLKIYRLYQGRKKIDGEKLKQLCKIAQSYDIIVVHHPDPYLYFSMLYLKWKFPDKKYISMIHYCAEAEEAGHGKELVKQRITDILKKQMIKTVDKVLFVSAASRDAFLNYYSVDPGKIEIVYNGIGLDKLELGKRVNLEAQCGNEIRLLYIGRLEPYKGVEFIVRAFVQLCDKHPITLTIVGDGSSRAQLEQIAQESPFADKIKFAGFQTNVDYYLTRAEIFCHVPTCQEAFGLSVVEAMAYGLICLTNNSGGLAEIVTDDNGVCVKSTDVASVADGMEKAIQVVREPEKYKEMRINGRGTAEAFSIENTVEKLNAVYNQLYM